MDQDEFERFQKFYEQMKRQEELQKDSTESTPSPTGEKGSARTQQTPLAKNQPKGKNVASTEATRRPFASTVSKKTTRTPFGSAMVKNWYNQELEKQDKETWDKFNGCFKANQSNDTRTVNYWLSQLEKSHSSLKERNSVLQKKLGEVQQLVSRLVSFSSTLRSEMLNTREKDLFSGTSYEQGNLKSIFSKLQTADLVNLSIQDFLELLKTLEVQAEELESSVMVQKMINLYQQNLIDDDKLLVFFRQLEEAKNNKRREEWQQPAAKKVKKDSTESTSSPSPTGEKQPATGTKQTPSANSQQKGKNIVST